MASQKTQFLVVLCILSCSSFFVSVSSQQTVVKATVVVDGTTIIGRTDEDFICATLDWWPPEKCDYGTCSWDHTSLINLDLNDKILLKAIQAFSPLKIRLGGTLQDKVIYDTPDNHQPCAQFVHNTSELFGFTQGCLPMYRWDELNSFFVKSGAKIIFGLNALMGKTIQSDGSAAGPWNYSNAQSFITYSVKHNYSIHGWELGNELSGSGVGTRVPADQYASDTISLHEIVENVYSGIEPKPLVLAPAGFYDSNWFRTLIDKAGTSLDIVTHHIYNLGPGVDTHLVEKILNPEVLDNVVGALRGLQSLLRISQSSATAWVGESGGAYNSGRNLVSNAFVYSFWYLDQLGLAAAHDTKTYCRQSLIGGNYGLLNTTTYVPNPDYYSALLWHQLMGRNSLSTSFSGSNKLRVYAHCAKYSKRFVLLLINLDNSTTFQVNIGLNSTLALQFKHNPHRHHSHRTEIIQLPHRSKNGAMRDEYHLTPEDGNLHSQTMLLNGKSLKVTSDGDIPEFEPSHVNSSEPITVAPLSIVFARVPYILPACR
ncbi:Heparanase-like protein 3 [Linum perenne]